MVDSAAQQSRPSVTWDLGSPSVFSASQATTSSGTNRTRASPHVRFGSQPEIHVGTHPQICFLRPRTAQPLVLFRCSPDAQGYSQTPAPPAALGTSAVALPEPRARQTPREPGFLTDASPTQLLPRPAPRTPRSSGVQTPSAWDSQEKLEFPSPTCVSSESPRLFSLPGLRSYSPGVPSALWASLELP